MAADEGLRYYWQHMDEVNYRDLTDWIHDDVLVAIVDEDEGGIIAYCHFSLAGSIVPSLRRDSTGEKKDG